MFERINKKLLPYLLALGITTGAKALDNATVQGNVSTESENVKKALVTLVNEADTTKKYFNITDDFGNYFIIDVPLALEDEILLPTDLKLGQNYPNPSNPSTIIPYETGKTGKVSLKVYDILGREVKTLVDRVMERGEHQIEWDGRNNQGKYVSSGIYLYVLTDGEKRETKKMVIMDGRAGVAPIRASASRARVNNTQNSILEKILTSATASTYRMEVTNTEETEPAIIDTFLYNIPIDGDTTINVIVQKLNRAPSVENVLITPENPVFGDTLKLFYDFIDPDGDSDQSVREWYRNNKLTGVNGLIFPPDSTQANDSIKAVVKPYDGKLYGLPDTSNIVVVQRLLYAPTIDELADKTINEDEAPADSIIHRLKDKIHDEDTPLDSLIVEMFQTNPGLVNLSLDDSLRIVLDSLQAQGYGFSDITIRVTDPDNLSDEKSFRFNVNEMDDISGYLHDIMTDKNISGVVEIDSILTNTDSLGYFNMQITPNDQHTLKAQGYDSIRTTFITTKKTQGNEDIEDVLVKLVPLLHDSTGVSDTLFYDFALQGNFRQRFGYNGLKKIDFDNAQHPDSGFVYWISLYNPTTNDTFDIVEQDTIKYFIENYVFPSIKDTTKRPSIYIATAQDTIPRIPDSLKPSKYGYCLIVPRRGVNSGIVTIDDDSDGIMEKARIALLSGYYQAHVVQEALSWLIAPNEVGDYPFDSLADKTALHKNTTTKGIMQPADYLLMKIALNFPEKQTQIDEILGLGKLND